MSSVETPAFSSIQRLQPPLLTDIVHNDPLPLLRKCLSWKKRGEDRERVWANNNNSVENILTRRRGTKPVALTISRSYGLDFHPHFRSPSQEPRTRPPHKASGSRRQGRRAGGLSWGEKPTRRPPQGKKPNTLVLPFFKKKKCGEQD